MERKASRVLVIGVGGIGSPLALILARAGVGTLGLVDDDVVERTNLHRQILFADADVGREKLDAAARGLLRLAPSARPNVVLHRTRLLPENAVALISNYDLVVEGADNFPTKFLVADACRVAQRPVVHAAAVRDVATVLAVSSDGRPCYRCLFEDLPEENAPNCAEAGVLGPLVGLAAAVQADLALAAIDGGARFGELAAIDGAGAIRRHVLSPRRDCALCAEGARPAVDPERYVLGGEACTS